MKKHIHITILLIFLAIIIFPKLALSSVEGVWNVKGMFTTRIWAEEYNSKKITKNIAGSIDDFWTFHGNGNFETEDIRGTWSQNRKKFVVNFNTEDIVKYFKGLLYEDLETNITVVEVTKIAFTGKEQENKTISGSFNIYLNVSIYKDDCDCVIDGRATVSGNFRGNYRQPPITVAVLKENYSQEMMTEGGYFWNLDHEAILKNFYEFNKDEYDFLIVFPMKPVFANYALKVKQVADGIGHVYTIPLASDTEKLKTLIIIPDYPIYQMGFYQKGSEWYENALKTLREILAHEIGHTWCCYLDGVELNFLSHWVANIDLFSGQTFLDQMGYAGWFLNDGGYQCVDGITATSRRFSNLTLYLMGLIPFCEVQPLYIQKIETDDTHIKNFGPYCSEVNLFQFIGTKEVTIDEIISVNGPRIPAYPDIQKDFRIKFVVLAGYDQMTDMSFIEHLKETFLPFTITWSELTSRKSKIVIAN